MDCKSLAFCAMQGEPHGGERLDIDVRAGLQRGRSRSVSGKAKKVSPRRLQGSIARDRRVSMEGHPGLARIRTAQRNGLAASWKMSKTHNCEIFPTANDRPFAIIIMHMRFASAVWRRLRPPAPRQQQPLLQLKIYWQLAAVRGPPSVAFAAAPGET
jgi:hypothetical protein